MRTGTSILLVGAIVCAAPVHAAPTPPQGQAGSAAPPPGSVFKIPAANECQSPWDKALAAMPGVIAYWPLCEAASSQIGHDYVGQWDSAIYGTQGNMAYGAFTRVRSPIADGETAAQSQDSSGRLGEQGIMINKRAGTLAAWVNNDAPSGEITLIGLSAVTGGAAAAILTQDVGGKVCYEAVMVTPPGSAVKARDCSTTPNTWHPVVMTWDTNTIRLYIDSILKKSATYTSSLTDAVYRSSLFPSYAERGSPRQTSMVKALVSNQTWSAATVAAYTRPALVHPLGGGAFVTSQKLGTLHADLLGYADLATDLSTPALRTALLKGVASAGFRNVRYSGSFGGITADQGDWHIGAPSQCGASGQVRDAANKRTSQALGLNNNLDTYEKYIVQPTGMHITYTVNYGSDPRTCQAGGDAVYNGAELVRYANIKKGYGIKFWEIGNEQGGCGSKVDLHPDPTCADGHVGDHGLFTYPTYEPAFYDAMKKVDPGIKIAVPMNATGDYDYIRNFTFNCMANCHFDAIVDHLYPMSPPVTDGASVYPDRLASGVARIRGSILAYQTLMLSYGRDPSAIWMTEWDGSPAGNTWNNQSLGAAVPLYAAQQLGEYANLGLQNATWWVLDGNNYCARNNQDPTYVAAYNWFLERNCGSFSPVYTGSASTPADEEKVGLQPGDLTPVGHLFQLLSKSGFFTEGESALRIDFDSSGAPWLAGYAATHGKSYAVMLINRDRDTAHVVPVQFAGNRAGTSVQQWTYGRVQYDRTRLRDWSAGPVHTLYGAWTNTFPAVLPPWSVSVFIF